MQVSVRARISPTEDPARVRSALLRLFPEAEVREEDGGITAATGDLTALRRRVWELRIIDTFRGQFLQGASPDMMRTQFRLSKQAALAGHVSFSPRPHVLGDLEVTVSVTPQEPLNIEQLAWWLAPETKDGEIVGPH